jgi:hypothetical protein
MSQPLTLKKFSIQPDAFKALQPGQRSVILVLGYMMNEANWLRKLLVQAVVGLDDTLEGQAKLGLVLTLASTLASKLHEGWLYMTSAEAGPLIRELPLSPALLELRRSFKVNFDEGTLSTIRNKIGFHYPRHLDVARYARMSEEECVIVTSENGYNTDLFSYLSALALLEALVAEDKSQDWQAEFNSVWSTVTEASGQYCMVVSEILAFALQNWLAGKFTVRPVDIGPVPKLDDISLVFFAHPPKIFEDQKRANSAG